MTDFHLVEMLSNLPLPHDLDAVKFGIENWRTVINELAAQKPTATDVPDIAKSILNDPGAKSLLETIFGNSFYLSQCVLNDPKFFCDLVCRRPEDTAATLIADLAEKDKYFINELELMKALRILKRRMALTIAVADIGNVWEIEQITRQLSDMAAITLSSATSYLLRSSPYKDFLNLTNDLTPETDSGLIVIGMGKLGAFELNYSSDIDLIVLYDADKISSKAPEKLQNQLVRLTRQLLKVMNERTKDGYVFRTDLRLRPDPGATPIALSLAAAETYYESLGQNWERAAMIKARPVAGDLESGAAFLKNLTPFVWRKSLDFAAIQDIQSIKRQINVQSNGSPIKCEGHNIKLGSGGIREIEFFAQTLQLIWGGREPELRSPRTTQALQGLVKFGHCDRETTEDLINSYKFLRRTEHRLQMINDEQTQTLPQGIGRFTQLATFLGYKTPDAFRSDLSDHLDRTHGHYRKLFSRSTPLSAEGKGSLSFTGGDPDPGTLKTITEMGFEQPDRADATVRGWHHGRYRALRNTRARELLTELLPSLMEAIGQTPDPDMALLNFDEFLQGLPAGVQLFTMIKANPQLMNLLAEIMGMAPRLAAHLTGRPAVLDSVLTPGFFEPIPPAPELKNELNRIIGHTEYIEDILNATRRWAHDRRFQVGVQRLRNLTTSSESAIDYSSIAETALECMFTPVADEFIAKHGNIAGGEMAFIALGKLGSREMTASSDLDLIIIYRAQKDGTVSNGERPLSINQYFARLSQRQINALTALTQEGGLFEVDMRLRPLGESGPIASRFSSLSTYYKEQAWTWEHMALTRARVIFATSNIFRLDIEAKIRDILTTPRDKDKLLRDVSKMRSKLAREKPSNCLWSLKYLRGGMLDIEFIAQYLALRHANVTPAILSKDTLSLIENLTQQGYIDSLSGQFMFENMKLFQALQSMLSLTVEDEITADRVFNFSDALKDRLASVGNSKDFNSLEAKIKKTAFKVSEIFNQIIEEPAKNLSLD